jgi:nicotinate-nucleotide adenylyltransferase
MRLALFGGSFDPPHAGHIHIVNKALEVLDVDTLMIVPAYLNPFKSVSFASGQQRIAWLKEIFKSHKRVQISDFEVAQNTSVYTIETVKHFRPFAQKIYLIIGADNLEKLHLWHAYEELQTLVTFVIATRNGIDIPDTMIRLDIDTPISSTLFRDTYCPLGLEETLEKEITHYYKEHHEPTN